MAHLDKSHVTVHTYPEYHPDTFLATFRVDIDVATCGEITPLSTLDYLISSFDSDIITMDYRVRGFTTRCEGKEAVSRPQDHLHSGLYRRRKLCSSTTRWISTSTRANIFHTKMLIKEIELQNYLFNTDVYELPPKTRLRSPTACGGR